MGKNRQMTAQRFAFGPFVLDMQRGMLLREGRPLAVGQKGLLLLTALLQAPGQVVSKTALMQAAWSDAVVEEGNLSVQIAALRKLLGPQPDGTNWIATVARGGYRFAGSLHAVTPAEPQTMRGAGEPASSPEKTSIVVLPFVNVSGDKKQDYLIDGITEDIITALTRFRWFRVIGRNSSFVYKARPVDTKQIARQLGVRYVLEGSLQKSGQRLRISVQLVDASSANQIWAERYDMELTEAFALQDAIAERVVGAIEPELLKTEAIPPAARQSGNITAWDLVRQGTWHFHHVERDSHFEARALFRQACKLDPELAEAHLWLGRVSAGLVAYGWAEQPEQQIREGLDAAVKAIRLDEKNPYSHYALAICSAYANAPEQTVLAAKRAIELNANFALGHLVLGMGELFRGNAVEAATSLARGLMLNPHDPQNFVWYNLLSLAHLFAGSNDDALSAATRARNIRPDWPPVFATLTCCYSAVGQMHEARACFEQSRQLKRPTGDTLAPLWLRNAGWANAYNELFGVVASG
jgi:TolB-like protein